MKKSTRGFDNAVLIGFGSVAVALTVSKSLHHLRLTLSELYASLRIIEAEGAAIGQRKLNI